MNKNKFEQEFRNAFLGNEQVPEGSFKFYEEKLNLKRKEPLFKRRPRLVNLLMAGVFFLALVISNVATCVITAKDKYFEKSIEEILYDNFSKSHQVIHISKVIQLRLNNEEFNLFAMKTKDEHVYFIFNDLMNINEEVKLKVNEGFPKLNSTYIVIGGFTNKFYISESLPLMTYIVKCSIEDLDKSNVLVNYCSEFSI